MSDEGVEEVKRKEELRGKSHSVSAVATFP